MLSELSQSSLLLSDVMLVTIQDVFSTTCIYTLPKIHINEDFRHSQRRLRTTRVKVSPQRKGLKYKIANVAMFEKNLYDKGFESNETRYIYNSLNIISFVDFFPILIRRRRRRRRGLRSTQQQLGLAYIFMLRSNLKYKLLYDGPSFISDPTAKSKKGGVYIVFSSRVFRQEPRIFPFDSRHAIFYSSLLLLCSLLAPFPSSLLRKRTKLSLFHVTDFCTIIART